MRQWFVHRDECRGSLAWSKAPDSGSGLVGVRGFKSLPLHPRREFVSLRIPPPGPGCRTQSCVSPYSPRKVAGGVREDGGHPRPPRLGGRAGRAALLHPLVNGRGVPRTAGRDVKSGDANLLPNRQTDWGARVPVRGGAAVPSLGSVAGGGRDGGTGADPALAPLVGRDPRDNPPLVGARVG